MRCYIYMLTAILLLFGAGSILAANPVPNSSRNPFNPDDSRYEDWQPVLVNDEIMPSATSITAVANWEKTAFHRTASNAVSKNSFPSFLSSPSGLPFSFVYGGKSSLELLPQWKFSSSETKEYQTTYTWTDPQTGLTVIAEARRFQRFASVDWVLRFRNDSQKDTPILSDVKSLDLSLPVNAVGKGGSPVLYSLLGDSCNDRSWTETSWALKEGENTAFAPNGGRPSNGQFPFWNLTAPDGGQGTFIAIGWSGQWSASFDFLKNKSLHLTAGQQTISTVLHPGETIRAARILLMPWQGNRDKAHVLFRRLLLFEYAPKMSNGAPEKMLLVGQCFDRYYRKRPGWEKFDAQVAFAKKLKEAGCEAYWFDAAWFPVGFPNGVGNWMSDKANFPGGLEELGREIKKLGLKFVLWFEPERVAPGTQIAKEHRNFVFGGDPNKQLENNGLFKLNDPTARAFLTDLLSRRISEYQVDVYRNDFNIDPLPFWQANDGENRRGMTEIRYIEGHYEMWAKLRKAHPGLWIDNCASGGRRIDLETTSISIPLWRSDTFCWPGHCDWDQNQMLGLARYLPLFSGVAWDPSPYTFRSAANMGAILQYNFLDNDYDPALAKASVAEARTYRKFWYGDFYPLTPPGTGTHLTAAWQLHRSDLNAGLIYMFRRENSPFSGLNFRLNGIDPQATYELHFKSGYTVDKTLQMTGEKMSGYTFVLPTKKSCLVVEYRKVTN